MEEIIKQIENYKGLIQTCEDMIDQGGMSLDEQRATLDAHWSFQNELMELEKKILNRIC